MTDMELMAEAAILYYEKKMTQQEIAEVLYVSRQTVSKLLTEALNNNIVEIKVHHPQKDCDIIAEEIQRRFGIKKAVICGTESQNYAVRQMMTIKSAVYYISPFLKEGNLKIAISWGRTIQTLIDELPTLQTQGNIVFPLFGATDNEHSYFSSNELARSMADKIGAAVKYAWFPYLPDTEDDRCLLMKTSYYKRISQLWENIDMAIVGIGNRDIMDLFLKTFGHRDKHNEAIGDIATRFFTGRGRILNLYGNTLCASTENIQNAKNVVAVACGNDKTEAITGALRTTLVDVLVTDEHTAKSVLSYSSY